MDTFLHRFAGKIKGVISGFDRIVFKGCIRPLMFPDGAMSFFRSRGVLNKDYKAWVMERSAAVVEAADRYARSETDRGVEPIASYRQRKETLAHERQKERGVRQGLIGVWSSQEACWTYRACYDAQKGFPQLRSDHSRCKHLYFYHDHAEYGFMSIRLQTWFPYGIQIALNGREWLRRILDREAVDYVRHGNKFLYLADYARAQQGLEAQLDTRWARVLDGFVPGVFPEMARTLGPGLSYYWTLWQSEWATDYIFDRPATLRPLMDGCLRHALMTGTGDRVLRYMGRPVDAQGQPHPRANPEVLSRAQQWHDGARIRHWVDNNSVKLYNEHTVLRVEMTMNNPAMFRVWRRPEGQSRSRVKRYMPLRKGIADIPVRARVAGEVNNRFMEQMATVRDDTPLRDLLKNLTRPFTDQGRRVRALDITGKDRELLLALADPQYAVGGLTNLQLRNALKGTDWARRGTDKQLSARISRHLRLLRDHGIIRKLPKRRRYALTSTGRSLSTALHALLAASTQQLMESAA